MSVSHNYTMLAVALGLMLVLVGAHMRAPPLWTLGLFVLAAGALRVTWTTVRRRPVPAGMRDQIRQDVREMMR